MKLPLTFVLLFLASLCFAQRQNVYFLKNNGKHVEVRDSADYIRIVREPDSGSVNFNVFEYYLDGKVQMLGKSSTVDPLTLEEQCIRFFKNGGKKTASTYKKGLLINIEYYYFPNGKIYQALTYPDNGLLYNELENNFLINECRDSTGTSLVSEGNGHYIGYDEDFKKITEQGDVKNGKREGVWQGRNDNRHTSFEETYNNGILVTGFAKLDDGKTVNYTKARSVAPQFRGGLDGFARYLSNNIQYPDIARENNIQGKVVLSFVVEKDGRITEIKVTKSVVPVIDQEAVRVLNNSPKWVPGTMYGSPVRVQYSVPVSFALN
ncbi:energy transducer TonB [Mucilaginibacter dorajii]|uniref:TonB C-terminal domain-containing protein n=1 Tax=Mucilaginibacter dorajii TaxID=692994 RepID=A0ABP7PYC4_9SPHI|nr:energy transducer TonB [Mucilaginibacter dorajii]MCS3736427.1 TonB family protein [Mucilaginibacter dorajii]